MTKNLKGVKAMGIKAGMRARTTTYGWIVLVLQDESDANAHIVECKVLDAKGQGTEGDSGFWCACDLIPIAAKPRYIECEDCRKPFEQHTDELFCSAFQATQSKELTNMDPNANLEEQRELSTKILDRADAGDEIHGLDAVRLAELVQALDEWIKNGGFLPAEWRKK